MSLKFIIGSSGSGKTRLLYENLILQSEENQGDRFFAVVPEQFTMQTQKELVTLHPRHGVTNIDIVSFQRLAYRIFEELDVVNPKVLDDMGKSMVLRKVLAGQKKELVMFGGHLNQNGFVSQLKSMLSELYQYGISAQTLDQLSSSVASPGLRQKLLDIGLAYRSFQEYINEKFITAEEILDVLCKVLPRSKLIKDSVITLDGFTGFTPVQYRVIEVFLRYAKKVVVTVTLDPLVDSHQEFSFQDLFYMSLNTVKKLNRIAEINNIKREKDTIISARPCVRFGSSGELDFLERSLFRSRRMQMEAGVGKEPCGQIFLRYGANPAEEIGFTANQIKNLIRREGLRYRDVAVITGDLGSYSNGIVQRFEADAIPFFLDYKKSIMENSMVEFLRAAIELVRNDFSYDSVFRYIKTGFISDKREELDRLENYVRALGIRGFKGWSKEWEWLYRGAKNLNLAELNELREEILKPLIPLREVFYKKEVSVEEMTKAVVHFLEALHVEEKLLLMEAHFKAEGQLVLAQEYAQVYGLVAELLDRIVGLLGSEQAGRKEYAEILDAGFEEIKVGMIPAAVDRVVVGDITRTRLDHVKVLFFLGINDGIVPQKKESGGILTDKERGLLGKLNVELAPTVREEGFMQRFYLYLLLTKASRSLFLSYSLVDSGGKSLRPSTLITEIKNMFPSVEAASCSTNWEPASSSEAKQQLIEGLREYEDNRENFRFLELYRWFFRSEEKSGEVKRLVEAAFYSYEERGIGKAAAKALYGAIISGSVTRLEKYAACAYAHFLGHGLELMERQEYELKAVDIGNLFHSSIDLYFRQMRERGLDWSVLAEEERRSLVRECVNQVSAEYGNTILQSSARNAYMTKKVEAITDRTIWALGEQMKKGDFKPTGFEVSFSAVDNLKAMKISLSETEALHLKGRIDRLDLCEDETNVYVKIIDYKSGSTSFDLAALYYGLQLQLVVYMDAVMEMQERKNPEKKVVPAGIFYYNIQDPMIEKKEDLSPEEIDRQILRQLKMNGLVNSDLDVIRHLDRNIVAESDVIPVAMKDGLIQQAKSSAAGEKRFLALRDFVNDKLREDARTILSGDCSVSPCRQGNRTACDFCPYHPVCGFDLKVKGFGYRRLPSVKAEAVWAEIEGKEKEEENNGH